MRATTVLVCIFALVIALSHCSDAYRKPPFNGSIFGKRNSKSDTDMPVSEFRYAMCEAIVDSCSKWFPSVADRK
ncbi:Uncharacterised protein g4357 [Pycnogonum litorale]